MEEFLRWLELTLRKHKATYCDFERTQDQLSRITLDFSSKTTEMQKLEQKYDSVVKSHEERVVAWMLRKKL